MSCQPAIGVYRIRKQLVISHQHVTACVVSASDSRMSHQKAAGILHIRMLQRMSCPPAIAVCRIRKQLVYFTSACYMRTSCPPAIAVCRIRKQLVYFTSACDRLISEKRKAGRSSDACASSAFYDQPCGYSPEPGIQILIFREVENGISVYIEMHPADAGTPWAVYTRPCMVCAPDDPVVIDNI